MPMGNEVYLGTGGVPRAGQMLITRARTVPRRIVRLGIPTTYNEEIVIPTPVPGALSQLPVPLNLEIYAGDDFGFSLVVNDIDGSPPELDSVQILAQVRAVIGGNVLATMGTAIRRNVITLTLSSVKTQNLRGEYLWDVQARDYYGLTQTFAFGTLIIIGDISRAPPVIPGGGPGPGPGPGPEPAPETPLWLNDTHYLPGDLVRDPVDGVTVWICLVNHTSAGYPASFAMDRLLNPTFWSTGEEVPAPVIQPWTNDTTYAVGTVVAVISNGTTGTPVGSTEYWACSAAHTSPSPPTTFYQALIGGGTVPPLAWSGPLSSGQETIEFPGLFP